MVLKKQCMYIPIDHALGTEVAEVIVVTVGPACSGKKEELKKKSNDGGSPYQCPSCLCQPLKHIHVSPLSKHKTRFTVSMHV